MGVGLPRAVGGGVRAGCVEPSDSRRHLARRVSLWDAPLHTRPLCTPVFGDRRCLLGLLLFSLPVPLHPVLSVSSALGPEKQRSSGPAASGPPLPTVPSLRQPPAPAREKTGVCQARGGRGGLGEGGARFSGTEASTLQSGRWTPCETGPPRWGRVCEAATD